MEGILAVLKPPAMSSSNVVVDIKKMYGTKHVGHLGTLDPEAAGVLPVCVGRAVRLFDYLVDKDKEYIAEIVFGTATDTQDAQGTVIARSEQSVSRESLLSVLPLFCGEIEQIAPSYSALKHNGKKLYDLARAGKDVPEKRRRIHISKLELAGQTDSNRYLIKVGCSRGTYIRTLCADIGEKTGCPSHMGFLLRTQSGPFTIENSLTLAQIKECVDRGRGDEPLVSCESALMFLPPLELHPSRKIPSLNGLDTTVTGIPDGKYRLYADHAFLGIGTVAEENAHLSVNLYLE